MTNWTTPELHAISQRDDFHIAPFRQDGETPGTPTWIWSVRVGDNIYVRAYHGTGSRGFQAARAQRAGQVRAAGQTHAVGFEVVRGPVNDDIDQAYREKYAGSPYLASMISEQARAATLRVFPNGR